MEMRTRTIITNGLVAVGRGSPRAHDREANRQHP
jgi:hypothetical protein